MKIPKTEFKAIIKESLKELINEGALDHILAGLLSEQASTMQQYAAMNDPRVKMAAAQIAGGDPRQSKLMEQILADTAMNTLPEQQSANSRLPNGMPMPGNMMSEMQGYNMPSGMGVPRNPLPPREMVQQPQQQGRGFVSEWARLAFNSPISNRPQSGAAGAPGGFLPGAKKGSFE
jgi:hypothetical protein